MPSILHAGFNILDVAKLGHSIYVANVIGEVII
jgi:hypothetical protein